MKEGIIKFAVCVCVLSSADKEVLHAGQNAPPPSALRVMEKVMLEFLTASKYVHFDPDLSGA